MKIDFSSSWGPSLGVEWELELVDLDTRELTSASNEILAEIGPDGGTHPKAKHELLQSCVEIITDVCATVLDVRADLAATAAEVQAAARAAASGSCARAATPLPTGRRRTSPTTSATAPSSSATSGSPASCRSSGCTCTWACASPTR